MKNIDPNCENKMANQNQRQYIDSLIDRASDFHGHLGPFLVLGLRMGLIALRQLSATAGDAQLRAAVALEYKVPFSCMLDGVQISTKCTIGNKRLSWKESKKFGATFMFEGEAQIEVELDSTVVDDLKHKLSEKLSDAEVRTLARDIAFRPDSELFSVRCK